MRRRRVLGLAIMAIVILAGSILSGIVLGQDGALSHIYSPHPGDQDVIAVIGDVEVTRRALRVSSQAYQAMRPELSEEAAKEALIVQVLDSYIAYAEAKERGLEASLEETQAYIEPIRLACTEGTECAEGIKEMGMTQDEYWRISQPLYRRDLSMVKLFRAFVDENNLQEASNEERLAARSSLLTTLRSTTPIEWKDQDLKQLYEKALQERTFLEP